MCLYLSFLSLYLCVCQIVCVCSQVHMYICSRCSVAQSCPALWDPVDCSPPASSVHGIFPSKYIRAGCLFLVQGIILIQGSKLHVLHSEGFLFLFFYHWAIREALYIWKYTVSSDIIKTHWRNLYIIPSIRIDMRVYWKIIHQGFFHYL